MDSNNNPDYIIDDSALAIVEGKELIIVTGCSHAGVCNIINHAIKTTGIRKVKAIIGGFHLKRDDEVKQKQLII